MDIEKVVAALGKYSREMAESDTTVQDLRAEVERLKQELSDSTSHYNGIINDFVKLREEASAELERLKTELAQAISERTPHDYELLASQRDDYRERLGAAAKEVFELKAEVKLLTTERDGYFSEMERMQKGWGAANQEIARLEDHIEDLKKAAMTNLTAAVALVRPEPSRLEIAAMLLANDRAYEGPTMALKRADALMAAAKEVPK
jgi:archaellum component FlaC